MDMNRSDGLKTIKEVKLKRLDDGLDLESCDEVGGDEE